MYLWPKHLLGAEERHKKILTTLPHVLAPLLTLVAGLLVKTYSDWGVYSLHIALLDEDLPTCKGDKN